MVALETVPDVAQEALEGALSAWLAGAGSGDRAGCEARLRFGRAVINRLEVGFARDAWAYDRFRDHTKEERTADWMRRELSMGLNAANAALKVGLFADDVPRSVAATEEGRIGFGHLNQIAGVAECAARIPVPVADDELMMAGDVRPPIWTEDALLAKAEKQLIGAFTTTCDNVQHELDADAVTRRLRTQMESQRVELWQRADGSFHLHGWLDADNGLTLRTALTPLVAPRDADDKRSYANRMAEALGELAMIALDAGGVPAQGGVRPHVSIVAGVDTLLCLEGAMAAFADEGGALPDHVAARLACDATVSRVLLDAKSVPIDVGREVRVVPPALRRALVARDRGCRWPSCTAPPSRCQAHHIVHWVEGGETNRSNCLLLCRRHHRLVHEGMWELSGDANAEVTVRERGEPARHGDRPHNWLRVVDAEPDADNSGAAPGVTREPDRGPSVGRVLAWELAARRAESLGPAAGVSAVRVDTRVRGADQAARAMGSDISLSAVRTRLVAPDSS